MFLMEKTQPSNADSLLNYQKQTQLYSGFEPIERVMITLPLGTPHIKLDTGTHFSIFIVITFLFAHQNNHISLLLYIHLITGLNISRNKDDMTSSLVRLHMIVITVSLSAE